MTKLPVALYESFQPRFSPELSLRNRIETLWVWVLMGSGDFSPQKGPKTFGPAIICEGQDKEKGGSHQNSSGCCRGYLYTVPGVFWKPSCETYYSLTFLVGVTIHQIAPSPVPQFKIYNSPDSGLGMLIILCSKMNILCLREGQALSCAKHRKGLCSKKTCSLVGGG